MLGKFSSITSTLIEFVQRNSLEPWDISWKLNHVAIGLFCGYRMQTIIYSGHYVYALEYCIEYCLYNVFGLPFSSGNMYYYIWKYDCPIWTKSFVMTEVLECRKPFSELVSLMILISLYCFCIDNWFRLTKNSVFSPYFWK